MKFAVIARGPKEGELILSRKEKLKRKVGKTGAS